MRAEEWGRGPEISVLVPVCNVERYLKPCLDSLIGQSFKDMEIICVDDGSTDQSGAILDKYGASEPRMKIIHKENTGYGNSMNVAMDHARGKYIAILESDDFAEPDMLQKLYEAAVRQGTDVVKGDYFHYQDNKDTFANRLGDYGKGKVINSFSCPRLLNLADSIWSCLYKHSFLTEHNIRFHETPGASYQDISFALQVWLWAESVYLIGDALLHYRRDNPWSSMNDSAKLFCVFDEYKWAGERMGKLLGEHSILRWYFTASKYRDYLNHYHRVGVQYQYALLLRLEACFREDKEKGWVAEPAFLPSVWKKICEIETDRDRFFKKTARTVWDSRLTTCRFHNHKVYGDAFFKALKKYPKVFIYGAGQVGRHLAEVLLEQGGQVDGFLETKSPKKRSVQIPVCRDLRGMGTGEKDAAQEAGERISVPVMEVREAVSMAEACAVIVAVTEWSQYELYGVLRRYGFCHIFRTDEVIRKVMGEQETRHGRKDKRDSERAAALV